MLIRWFVACMLAAGCNQAMSPLAVAKGTSGDLALAAGVLEITDNCVFLELAGERTLLVWPEHRTSWDGRTRTIKFQQLDGTWIELRSGQPIAFGGGGSSEVEDGLSGEDWAARISWAAPPRRDCLADIRWMVTDVSDQVLT